MLLTTRIRFTEWAVLLLLVFSVLWKGGKSLEATWLLAGLGGLLTLSHWIGKAYGRRREPDVRAGETTYKGSVPLGLWAVCLLYIVWSALSFMLSETMNYGLDEILRSCGYILVFLWAARMQTEENGGSLHITYPVVLTGVASVAGLIGVVVYALQPVNRFVGSFFDMRFNTDYWPNAWAEFLLLAWPTALIIALRAEKKSQRITLFAMLSFIVSTLLLSYSRGAMIAAAGQCVLLGALLLSLLLRDTRYRRMAKSIVKSVILTAAAVGTVAALLFSGINAVRGLTHSVQSVTEKVTFTAAEGTSSINERAQFWDQAKTLAKERPAFGWGPYSFRFLQPQSMQHVLATSDHPHNVLLKFAMERGYPSAFLFVALFGGVLGLAILSFFFSRKASSPETDVPTALYITGIAGVLLHVMIDYNLQFVGVGLPCVISLGLLVPAAKSSSADIAASFRRWRARSFFSRIEVFMAIVLLGVCMWEGVFLVTSSLGRHALAGGDAQTALAWFGKSHRSLFSRDLYLSEADIYMANNNIDAARASLNVYATMNKHDARLWKMRGILDLKEGKFEEAEQNLEKAYELGRYTDLSILRLLLDSRTRNATGENTARKEEFDALFSAYADAIEQNTHFIALSFNVEELPLVAELLGRLYPMDAERYASISSAAVAHATEEREKFKARTPGLLW